MENLKEFGIFLKKLEKNRRSLEPLSNYCLSVFENGKLFFIQRNEQVEGYFEKIKPNKIPFKNLPFENMVISFGIFVFFITQEQKTGNILAQVAELRDGEYLITNLRGELYNKNGLCFYWINYFKPYIEHLSYKTDSEAQLDAKRIFIMLKILIQLLSENKRFVCQENNISARKCSKAERPFRIRYNVIPIENKPTTTHARNKDAEPTGRKIALHDRRGHYRRLKNKTVWVRACKVGSIKAGMVLSSYSVK